jgi:hypothetical protein
VPNSLYLALVPQSVVEILDRKDDANQWPGTQSAEAQHVQVTESSELEPETVRLSTQPPTDSPLVAALSL